MTNKNFIIGVMGTLGLVALVNAQSADWRLVRQASSGGLDFYLDVNSPRSNPDGMVTARVLAQYSTDQRTRSGKTYRSLKKLVRFDCAKESLADQSMTFHAESHGKGPVVQHMERTSGEANSAMEPTRPGSAGKAMVYAACEVHSRGKPAGS
jgi:hypothetical protein